MAREFKFMKDKKKNAFLNALLKTGTRKQAADLAKVSRQAHYFWMKNDDEYVIAYERVRQMLIDVLEDAAFERAVNGVERKLYYKGEEIGVQLEYSDTLLALLLKANMPEKYKDKTETTVNVEDGSGVIGWEGAKDIGEDNDTVSADETMAADDTPEP